MTSSPLTPQNPLKINTDVMLRWIFGGREAQSSVEKGGVLTIGEEQPKNCFTELQVLRGHFDIVRFLVQIDDFRCASAGDDGLVLVWNVETGERLRELRGHSQQITAITVFRRGDELTAPARLITASSDRSVSLWDPDTGNRVQTVLDLQSSVRCLLASERLGVWMSGGAELCVWSEDFRLLCDKDQHGDTGISALIELPKNCVAAAVDKTIVIYKLTACDDSLLVLEVHRLVEHQDQIRALINVGDGLFASGSHAGELMVWDAVEWSVLAYEHILWEEPRTSAHAQTQVGGPEPSEMSVQHLTSNGKLILAAVGSGLYVFSVLTKTVVAYRKCAHDSNVLHTMLLSDSEIMSCSEDGSVRMWEIQDLPLAGEPASPGFFGMWNFTRSSKQACPLSNKTSDIPNIRTLELTGDLIGHSGAVQMFVAFEENSLVTCSADHQLILWKNGEKQSRLRSLALFRKLEENGGL